MNRHPVKYELWWGRPPHGDLILKTNDQRKVIDGLNEYIGEFPQKRHYTHIFVFQGIKRGEMDVMGRVRWKQNEKA